MARGPIRGRAMPISFGGRFGRATQIIPVGCAAMQSETDLLVSKTLPTTERTAMSCIATLFRCPFFQRVADDTHVAPILELADHFSVFRPPSQRARLGDWFTFFYRLLFDRYRCEYVYKNTIATRIFLSRHSLQQSLMTDEIWSARSRGDVAILNGTSTIYEIKSHYDSFERLDGQLADYKKVFDRIYIVTTEKKAATAIQRVEPAVGVIALRNDGALTTLRESASHKHLTDPAAIFDCMRQSEYCRAIALAFGYIPQVPNSQLYRQAKSMFCSLSPAIAHDLMVEQIKRRGKKRPFVELIESAPTCLKHVCLSFSKSTTMATKIAARLKEPLVNEKIFPLSTREAQ